MTFQTLSNPRHQDLGDHRRHVVAKAESNSSKILRFHVVIAIVCFLLAGLIASNLPAQNAAGAKGRYDVIQVDPRLVTEDSKKRMTRELRTYTTQGQGDVDKIKTFFEKYVPAVLTAPNDGKRVSTVVSEIESFIGKAGRSGKADIYRQINQMTAKAMYRVAVGNYRPAGRIAATTVLGKLNSRPANKQARQPPVPMSAVLPVLIKLYEDEQNVEGIRAAALHAIHRHAEYGAPGIGAEVRTKLTNLMMKLLDEKAGNGRSEKAHAYLQRFGVDILTFLRGEADASLGLRLVSLSTDDAADDLIALHSASRVGGMSADLQGQVPNVDQVIENWTTRIVESLESELERLAFLKSPRAPASGQPRDPKEFLESAEERRRARAAAARRGGRFGFGDSDESTIPRGGDAGISVQQYGGDEGIAYGGFGGDEYNGFGAPVREVVQPVEVVMSRRQLNFVIQQVYLGVTGAVAPGITEQSGGLYAIANDAQREKIQAWDEIMAEALALVNDKTVGEQVTYVLKVEEALEAIRPLGRDKAKEMMMAKEEMMGKEKMMGKEEMMDKKMMEGKEVEPANPIDGDADPLGEALSPLLDG